MMLNEFIFGIKIIVLSVGKHFKFLDLFTLYPGWDKPRDYQPKREK